MLGLKLNHVSKRGHWYTSVPGRMFFFLQVQMDIYFIIILTMDISNHGNFNA